MFSREDLALHVNKKWWGGTFAENGSRSTHSGRREKDDTGVAIPTVRVVTQQHLVIFFRRSYTHFY